MKFWTHRKNATGTDLYDEKKNEIWLKGNLYYSWIYIMIMIMTINIIIIIIFIERNEKERHL